MAELNARIIAKASGTASEEPLAADLEVAELAVNTADGKLFTKHTDGSIVTVSGGGGAVSSVNTQTGVVSLGIGDLTDVETVATAQGYEMQQGNFANSGEFQTNGSLGFLIDKRSKNSLGDLPQPQNNGSFWFSTSEYGPFTELTINGTVGLAGGFAYNIDFVSRSALDAVLTGSTTVYFHSVDPAIGPSDGQVLTWDNANSQWELGSIRTLLGIGEYVDDAAAGTGGVASGALYYNTTNSNYVLKT